MKKKRCPYCKTYFTPHPSVGQRQRACEKTGCQKSRKAKNNKQWRQKNPEYSKGEYPRIKAWLAEHPGYLKHYRQNHPEYREKNKKAQSLRDRSKKLHLDIQARLREQRTEIIDQLWNYTTLDIQAELNLQPIEITFLLAHFYHLAIQADLDR